MSEKRYVFKKQCGTCSHLIFKDHKHHEGRCSISGCDKKFESLCEFSHNIDRGTCQVIFTERESGREWRLNHGTTTEC